MSSSLRLQYRLALATFLPLLVFGLFGTAVGIYALFRIPEELAIDRQILLAQVAAAGVADNLQTHVATLQLTAAEVGSLTENATRPGQVLSARFRALGAFTLVAVLNARGDAVATLPYDSPLRGQNFADEDFFGLARESNDLSFSAVLHFQPTGRPAAVIAVPLAPEGPFAGLLIGGFALDRPYWARGLNLLNTPRGGLAYLVDQNGKVIFHPDSGRIGSEFATDPAVGGLRLGHAQGVIYRASAAEGPKVIAVAPIQGVGWGLVVEEPWDSVAAAILPYQYAAGGLMLVGLLLAVLALTWAVRRETKPLARLTTEGQRVARGEKFHPPPVEGSPDVKALISVVNEAMAGLAKQQEALRRYALEVLRGQEKERLRISRDLHDGTLQDLVALKQRIELCGDALQEAVPAARERLAEVARLAGRALTEVRQISHSLRPAILEDMGLVAALQTMTRELAADMRDSRVHCEIVGIEAQLPGELQLMVFRIGQEAMANVRKHAKGASRVSVALIFEDWGLTLQVEDDGPGFEVADRDSLVRWGHLGLAGMSERAQLFGAALSVESTPGNGTTVSLQVPQSWPVPVSSACPADAGSGFAEQKR